MQASASPEDAAGGISVDTMHRIAQAIASDLELERIVQTVTDAATELTGAQFGAFFYNAVGPDGALCELYTLAGAARDAFVGLGKPHRTPLLLPTFRDAAVIRCDDVRSDPRSGTAGGMPTGHLPVVSYLAVPVVSRSGAIHGGLLFGHERPAVFTAVSERVASMVAAHAAIAIDNARLFEQARREIAERRRAVERQRLLFEEMKHRVKNLFALAASLVSLGARSAASPGELAAAVGGRLAALARAHDLTFTAGGDAGPPARLGDLVATILAPYDGCGGAAARCTVRGGDVAVAGAALTSLSLLLYEFATNAAKHGCLSAPEGRLAVEVERGEGRVILNWRESGGPPPAALRRSGFGSQLEQAALRQLGGAQVERAWNDEGLAIRVMLPLPLAVGEPW
jgi:two-component sensor histidine kinase